MKSKIIVSIAVLAAGATIQSEAAAEDRPGYAASVYQPSERGSDWFANESNDYRGKFRLAIGVIGDYGYREVIGTYTASGNEKASVLREQTLIHPGLSVVFLDRFRIGASLPIALDQYGHAAQVGGDTYLPPQNAQSLGDLRVSADVRLLGVYGDPFTVATGASVFIPFGQRDNFTGDEEVRFAPHLNVAGDVGIFAYSARGGYELRPLRENYIDTRIGSRITFGGAVGLRLADKRLLIGPEIYGSTLVQNDDGRHETPLEIIASTHLNIAHGFRISAGAGPRLTNGFGAAMFRGLLGLEYFPDAEKPDRDKDGIPDDEDACPDRAGVRTGDPRTNGCPPPPPDRDGDGIIDSEDACPDAPGPRTNDPKTNGCPPPPDRDRDGILDSEDACPDDPGVRTNDPKTNGCPADRDGDGVYDRDDACPDVPGLKTSDPKTNGCPDPDRDKDGIPNETDACPDQAGPATNDPKTTGCPRVFIKAGLIQILEQPKFDFNKAVIKPESDSLLTEVAKVMTDHPEIKRVRVEGHTDNVGTEAYNKKLSEQRAGAVVKWLSSHGIAADRLSAQGIGKDRPLVPNDTDTNRALNRRVEFHIEDQAETVKEVIKTQSGATVPVPPTQPKP